MIVQPTGRPLTGLQLDVLAALNRPGTRWHTSGQVATAVNVNVDVALRLLNKLRERDLVCVRLPERQVSVNALWSTTTLGRAELLGGEQLRLGA